MIRLISARSIERSSHVETKKESFNKNEHSNRFGYLSQQKNMCRLPDMAICLAILWQRHLSELKLGESNYSGMENLKIP